MTTNLERHLLQHKQLQLISTKFEKKMRADGFDSMRTMLTTLSMFFEAMPFSSVSEAKVYGSTGEGIVYPVDNKYEKDIDIVVVHNTCIAVENDYNAIQYYPGMDTYIIENDRSLPGYCYLRVKHQDLSDGLRNSFLPVTYLSGSAIKNDMQMNFMNAISSQIFSRCQDMFEYNHVKPPCQHGPAINIEFRSEIEKSICKSDSVVVIRSPIWPSCASKWITRTRPYKWPTEKFIAEIVAKGIYFAPIGCKDHPLRDLQWRYSFNEAERRLIRSFNTTQAKCYSLLKRLISENVKPQFEGEDVISSYHIKTIMLWTIEETDPQVWIPANLIQCVFLVLNRLIRCVDSGNCPSYFMPEENLFLFKITPKNKEKALTCISSFIAEGWPVLIRLSNFAFDHDFIQYILEECDTQSYPQARSVYEHMFFESYEIIMLPRCLAATNGFEIHESDRIHSKFTDVINHLILQANECHDDRAKELIKNFIANVCSSYGTLCLSLSRCPTVTRSERAKMDDLGYKYIEVSCLRKQVECLVKYANFAYMRGDAQSVLFTADNIMQVYYNRLLPTISTRVPYYEQIQEMLELEIDIVNASLETGDRSEICAFREHIRCQREVMFMKNEIYAVPDNAKVEMFVDAQESGLLDPVCRLKHCFVVDPYVYLTYLVVLTYTNMSFQEEADKAITSMEIMCSGPPNSHLPSSLNLLGDCYLKRGKVDNAIKTFTLSMQRNSRRNAAPWHMARLVWRKLSDRSSQIHDADF